MANETPRMKITYPSLGEANYFSNYQAGMNDIDAGIFATWSANNTIANGGGTVTWDLDGSDYTLTWTSPIAFQTPAFGTTQSVASDSIIIPEGLLIYTDLSYGATAGSTALTFTVASQAPVDTAVTVFAWHNPTTNELHFASGLVLAVGASATGIQPQGGGGSISVTDGTTTVNPATTLTFTAGTVVDLGGASAQIDVAPLAENYITIGGFGNLPNGRSLIDGIGTWATDDNPDVHVDDNTIVTPFVVDKDYGSTPYTTIQDAIDAAAALRGLTGCDQIVYIRPSRTARYTENLTLYEGISLVGMVQQKRQLPDLSFPVPVFDDPIIRVEIEGSHTFGYKQVARSMINGITFYGKDTEWVFYLEDTDDNPSSIQFRNCRFEHHTGSQFFWQDSANSVASLTLAFSDCSFHVDASDGTDVFKIGSDSGDYGTRSTITFDRCFFINEGTNGHWMRLNAPYNVLTLSDCYTFGFYFDIAWWRCAVLLQRCTFDNKTIGGLIFDDNAGTGAGGGEMNFRSCTFRTGVGDYVWRATNSLGYTVYDNASIFDGFSTSGLIYPFRSGVNITYDAGGERIMPASFAGTHLNVAGGATYDIHMGVTTLVVNTDASVSSTTINLPDAYVCHGQEIAVIDGGNKAGSRNITVACPTSAVIGPHGSLTHNSQTVTYCALYWPVTSQWVWKSISSLF